MKSYETLVRIDVTAQDIAEGTRRTCTRCPVALAIHRKLLPHLLVYVTLDAVRINEPLKKPPRWNGEDFSLNEFGPGVSRFILEFDAGMPVQPFSFEVELPTKFLNRDVLPNPVG